MDYETVCEGETLLYVPAVKVRTKRDPVFYNPHMELSRDISVAVANLLNPVSTVMPWRAPAPGESGLQGRRAYRSF